MSAFLCSDRHIASIAIHFVRLIPAEDPQKIADRLKAFNVLSVNYRYAHHGSPEPIEPCSLTSIAQDLTPPDLVALCNCLDYQSCELPDYANPLLEAITAQFAANVRHSIKSPVWSI